jgi:sulfoxide reductase heme-binding subunit YedZ
MTSSDSESTVMGTGNPTAGRDGRSTIVPIATCALLVMIAAVLDAYGWSGEEAVRGVVRATARSSLGLFLAAFLASTLARRWPGPLSRWLLVNRRGVGLSFAVSHLFHGLALIVLGVWFPAFSTRVGMTTRVVGGLGFAVVAVLAATSNDWSVRTLGARRWALLHRVGVHYLWAVFFLTYLGSNRVLAAVLGAALVLRLRRR